MIIESDSYDEEKKFLDLYNSKKPNTAPTLTEKLMITISDLLYLDDKTIQVYDEFILINHFKETDSFFYKKGETYKSSFLEVMQIALDLIIMQKEDGFLENFTDDENDINILKEIICSLSNLIF